MCGSTYHHVANPWITRLLFSEQVNELTQFSEQQRNLVQTHANSLSQLRADVANIEVCIKRLACGWMLGPQYYEA